MLHQLTHYSWPVSPYSAKTRAYLRWRGLSFREVRPSALRLWGQIRPAVGDAVMPTLRLADGRWLRDSSVIIDTLDAQNSGPKVMPKTPRQRLACALMELHGDEWLVIPALHYRWNLPENSDFGIAEFGRWGFPLLPRALSKRLVQPIATKMAGYRRVVGITPDTSPGVESFTTKLIAQLQRHLSMHGYLLGERPCMADFAMYASLWAHLYRDPASTRLFEEAEAVVSWMLRLRDGEHAADGALLSEDEVPESLAPILRTIFQEQIPYMGTLLDAVETWIKAHPDASRLPRSLGSAPFVIGGCKGERRLATYSQWMLQRVLAVYAQVEDGERASVDAWLRSLGGDAAVDAMRRPIVAPTELVGFEMRLVR